MDQLLLEFINTLDLSLKKMQKEIGENTGFSKLTISQFQYLNAIYELGTPTITDLANRLHYAKASVTTGIQKLIELGYVTKTQSETDKRVFYVHLTETSQQLILAKYQAIQDYVTFIRAALNEEETQQFEKILAKLVQLFKAG